MTKMTHSGTQIFLWLAALSASDGVLGQTNGPSSSSVLTVVNRSEHPNSTAHDKPISLNFQNIDIKALLQVFADFSGLHVVPTDSVTGPVSVRLNDVPWKQALDIVLQSKGLVSRQEGRVLWISPQGEWALREKNNWMPRRLWKPSVRCK